MKLGFARVPAQEQSKQAFFYGWYIVGVGFLSHLVSAFHFSSTLSVFVKPLTEDFGVSRGMFSLLRTGEILIGGVLAPLIGPLVDRYSGRWLMAIGALAAGAGFLFLSQAKEFWQFLLLRWSLVTIGGAFMCSMVVTVTISRWFIRKRGRAIAIASLGQGIAKVGIPLLAASLFVWLGWRQTWAIFGILTLALVVGPAVIFMRRSPEEMGLQPDGAPVSCFNGVPGAEAGLSASERFAAADVIWSRAEVLRTQTFWLIAVTFGIANVGVVGLNLHVFAYVSDIGYPAMAAATVLSIIAFTQLSSTLLWGFLSERVDIRKATMLMFLIQTLGLSLVIATTGLVAVYAGFFIYGVGLGGSQVLQEIIWANYFGRISLGRVRGLGFLITQFFSAGGPPFFGFLFDLTKSYLLSFILFTLALVISAFLILLAQPPQKQAK
ncbi:MAG: MFS transporter [Deltaproteobacteria bacterium]|nr:MFS transporter [Deltaproteobacteria bacterium]